MIKTKQAPELSKKILGFHQENYEKPECHQVISDPKSSYFQYSRYFGILREFERFTFNNFIDIGCAEGMYLLAVKSKWFRCETHGVDFSSSALKKTLQFTRNSGSLLACADASHLPFKDNVFDLVLCSETLEHMVDDTGAIMELGRICKKACIITVPSFSNRYAKTHFKPDVDCRHDSHLRKYLYSELDRLLSRCFRKVKVYNMSLWYLSSADIIMHMVFPKNIASQTSHFFSKFAALDYYLSKAGAHGHSFICICEKSTN